MKKSRYSKHSYFEDGELLLKYKVKIKIKIKIKIILPLFSDEI